jgi:2-polyprenyl-6-methoxyphenol hydroxylase-like FAD-dependent oxidoreductase
MTDHWPRHIPIAHRTVRANGIDIHLVMHDTREPVDRAETTEVVVVGAGPTRLTAAIRLAELGVPHVVLDPAAEPTRTSKAALVHASKQELLAELGAGDELVAAGRRIRRIVIVDRGRVLTRIDLSNVPSRYPFALGVPQSTTERVLLRRLAALDGSVRREHRVGSVHQDPNGYLVAGMAYGSEPFQVRAGYVIGADGARSAVRSAIGQDLPGQTYPSQFVLADVALASAPCADDEASINLSRDRGHRDRAAAQRQLPDHRDRRARDRGARGAGQAVRGSAAWREGHPHAAHR